jgi:hypothetical protein
MPDAPAIRHVKQVAESDSTQRLAGASFAACREMIQVAYIHPITLLLNRYN